MGIIVSISGYSVDEMLAMLLLSYGLMLMVGLARGLRYMLDTEEFGKGSVWVPLSIIIGGAMGLTLLYQYPVRIGSVLFLVGALFAWLVHELVNVFGRWQPISFSFKSKKFQDWVAGEKHEK